MVRTRSWSISVNPVSPCFINSSTTNYLLFSYRSSSLMQRCCVFCRRPWTALDQQFFSPHLPSRAKNARASARRLCVYMGMWTVDGRLVAGCYLSMHQSVYLHICLSIYLSVCLPSCLSIYVHLCTINSSTEHSGTTTQEEWPPELILLNFGLYSYSTVIIYYVPVHTSIFPSIHPSVRPSVRLSICLSVCLSIYLSINPSVDLSTYAITDTDFLWQLMCLHATKKTGNRKQIDTHTHRNYAASSESMHENKNTSEFYCCVFIHWRTVPASWFCCCAGRPRAPQQLLGFFRCLWVASYEIEDWLFVFCKDLFHQPAYQKELAPKKVCGGLTVMKWGDLEKRVLFFILNFFSITKPICLGQSGCCYDDICRWPQSGWSESWI